MCRSHFVGVWSGGSRDEMDEMVCERYVTAYLSEFEKCV